MSTSIKKNFVNNLKFVYSDNNTLSVIFDDNDLLMGIVGEFNNPKYLENLEIVKKAAKKNNIRSGIHVINPNLSELKMALNDGYGFVAYSTDALLIYDRCASDLKKI